jgi:transcription elongation factor SPT6
MASPAPEEHALYPQPEDDPMEGAEAGEEEGEEGEGDDTMAGQQQQQQDDSSDEEEEDAEEARRIREGFIVDEDEEDEDEDDEEERKRRKRRKRHHRRRREEEQDLEEDDLDLLEENTGGKFKKSRLKRLVRRGRSESPPTASTSKRRAVVESDDEDLDDDALPTIHDIQQIWDDQRDDEDDDADGDIDDFIEYDDDEEGGMPMDEQAREERRRERRKQQIELRRKSRGAHPELAGIDANAWAEIHDVFGDGHEYDWALVADEEREYEHEVQKDMSIQNVFEPSEIRQHLLTEDDNLIRARDTPERMQLTASPLSDSATISLHQTITAEDLNKDGARWVTVRLLPDNSEKQREFFGETGKFQHLQGELVMAVTFALRAIFIEEYEVPYIWTHRRDYISHFDTDDPRSPRVELLSLSDLWRVYALGQKYRSLVERRNALTTSYNRLGVTDSYYTDEIFPAIDSVEVVADTTEWLLMKYKDKKQNEAAFRFHDDEEAEVEKKHKMPSRVSAYELAKKSIVSRLADVHHILSYIAS